MGGRELEYGELRRIRQYKLLTGFKTQMPNTPDTNQLITGQAYKDVFYIYAEKKLLNGKRAGCWCENGWWEF
jgi:hypothetical protein